MLQGDTLGGREGGHQFGDRRIDFEGSLIQQLPDSCGDEGLGDREHREACVVASFTERFGVDHLAVESHRQLCCWHAAGVDLAVHPFAESVERSDVEVIAGTRTVRDVMSHGPNRSEVSPHAVE